MKDEDIFNVSCSGRGSGVKQHRFCVVLYIIILRSPLIDHAAEKVNKCAIDKHIIFYE